MSGMAKVVAAISVLMLGVMPVSAQSAPNVIKRVQARQDGAATVIQVDMESDLVAAPGAWTVVEPPRIVFDFPGVTNGSGVSSDPTSVGDLKGLNLVQNEQQTRLVLSLFKTSQYSMDARGKTLLIRLEGRKGQPASSEAASALSAVSGQKATNVLSQVAGVVREVRFARGEDGQGVVTLDLSDSAVPIDVRRDGNSLIVELPGTELPQALRLKRDVNDFATPVTSVVSRATSAGTRIEIAARGKWFHQSRLTGNDLAIEVKQIPADDVNKLVQSGQLGQKVSINFFEAEATMVLRTLAEISGKNVMIDPSLAGRRITVTLDNIPYDQALEIVMAQVGSAMRVSDAIVLFGDRNVLQKRDQERADDMAKAADIAPLVSETFELSYLKAADVETLIMSAPSTQNAAGQPPAQGNQPTTVSGKGMLSARGSISKHEPTNLLFIRDTEERIAAIKQVIKSVDLPARQVMIEARIVRADTSFSRNLGVRLGYNDLKNTVGRGVGTRIPGTDGFVAFGTTSSGLQTGTGQNLGASLIGSTVGSTTTGGSTVGNPAGTGVGSSGFDAGLGGRFSPTAPFQGPSINLPVAGNTFAVSIFDSALTKFLNLELQASEAEGKTVSIASPRVVTATNLEAKISQGQKIPYSTASSTGTNTQFIDAVLSLSAKPQIAPNGSVILELKVKNDSAGTGSPPPINTAELNTKVTVENGGTVVLGGVILEETTNVENRIPVLGDIPYLGNLFKSNEKITRKGELLIFITPRVLTGSNGQ